MVGALLKLMWDWLARTHRHLYARPEDLRQKALRLAVDYLGGRKSHNVERRMEITVGQS
jgi:hypothetical protein